MEDLLSYRLSDLLLFSEQTFYRQHQLYRQWLGPFQYLAYLYGALFLFAWQVQRKRIFCMLISFSVLFWVICIYGYLGQLYAGINSMIRYLIPLLCIQPLLLLWGQKNRPVITASRSAFILWLVGLLLPVFELAGGRSTDTLPAYALSPDSLAICSIALMLIFRRSSLFFLPALSWLLFSALTYLAEKSSPRRGLGRVVWF